MATKSKTDGNQNVENSCIFCYRLHSLSDWEFEDVYYLLACRKLTTAVIAILSQSSGELCGPGPLAFSLFILNIKTYTNMVIVVCNIGLYGKKIFHEFSPLIEKWGHLIAHLATCCETEPK